MSSLNEDTLDTEVHDGEGDTVLEVENLKKHFVQNDNLIDRLLDDQMFVRAVDGVDLTIRGRETLAVVGESGCGKSTLAETLIRLHEPTDGVIRYKGDDISDLSDRQLRPYRQDIQMIFQDPVASLNPRQTVGEVLQAPMEVHNIGDSTAERQEIAKAQLERVGLDAGHIERYPHQFSGGQQQRIAIARALVMEPTLLLADEPVSALDVSVQAQILELLKELKRNLGLSLLFIAHDLSVVKYIADRVAVMYLGKIVETAPTEELFENPKHPYTKALLSAVPRIDPDERSERILLQGSPPSPVNPPSGCRFHTRCPAVIPPDDWEGPQEAFLAVFGFRNRISSTEFDIEVVRARLKEDEGVSDDSAVKRKILNEVIDTNVDIPEDAMSTVEDAVDAKLAGKEDRATEIVEEAFPSVCKCKSPTCSRTASNQMVKCHRHDPEISGQPDVF